MSQYTLPDLPYDYSALEPHISARIMELHHDKHHRAYVKGANDALEGLAEARRSQNPMRIAGLERALAFHLSGHLLHSIFWRNLAPGAGGEPRGALAEAINRDFGSFADFRSQFTQTATSLMGSGWATLSWDSVGRQLLIAQVQDHQSQIGQGTAPLMVLDVWEHAYYLQYQTEKAKYFEALWNLWNWDDIAARLESVQALDLKWGRAGARRKDSPPSHAHL
ncbi:MAG TPA: superoxide dismutase [Acidiferrobacteraceae bacterium]|nr:superoxide dismutase [Acidiferrobacteraceae bacterium]